MLALSLISLAMAKPSDGGIQIALFDSGADFAESFIAEQSFDIAQDDVSGEAACYDAVGIRNLNVHVPLGETVLEFSDDILTVDISFEQIHGEDMVIYGEDSDWLDVCPGFEADFHSFQIDNARVRLSMQPSVAGEVISLDVIGQPVISGDISTDIDWIPDALILSFIEDTIWDTLSDKIVETVPELVTEYLDTSLYSGRIGDLAVDVTLADVGVSRHALTIGMDLAADWEGESCLVVNAPDSPQGRAPDIDFGTGNDSALGIGVTERQLNGLLLGAYDDGLLCFDYGPLAGALDAVGDAISDPVENAEVDVEFGDTPVVRLNDGQMRLTLNDFEFALRGDVDGEPTEFIAMQANIEAAVELRVDSAVSSIVLDMVYVDLEVLEFQADALLSDQAGAEARLIGFLKGWVMDVVADRIKEVPLYSSLLYAADIYIRLDSIGPDNGALIVTASLFDGDDISVDTTAPQTQARVAQATPDTMTLQWQGTDDKIDPLSFSWRIDEGEWSSWTSDDSATVSSPAQGSHILEVRARDSWHNVDQTPALVVFEIPGPQVEEKGCRCTTVGASPARVGWLMLPLLWVRRRR